MISITLCVSCIILSPVSRFVNVCALETIIGEVEVRLVKATTQSEGRVEVRKSGTGDYGWGTVCDDYWDDSDATVVCRQLGFGDTGKAVSAAAAGYGTGSGSIYLDSVRCTGSEKGLADCKADPWSVHNCGHDEDAGVKCYSAQCGKGLYFDEIHMNCTECPLGTFQAHLNATACNVCPVGQYQDKTGQVSCTSCPVGQYQDKTGQVSCTPCPVGQYQDKTGQVSCTSCPVGQYQDKTGQVSCTPCPVGQYQDKTGQVSCTPCPVGQYQDKTGQVSCTSCPIGQYQSLTGQASCIHCPPGQYQNVSGRNSCIPCSRGQHQSHPGQSSCVSCHPGQFRNVSGQPSCTDCPAGWFQELSGQTSCTLCPPGHHQNSRGEDRCLPCPAGQHQPQDGQELCTSCPAGQYQDHTGQSSCAKCPDGTSTSSRGATSRENCTGSPVPTTTVTVILSYTLVVVCTDDQAKEVRTTLYTRVRRLELGAQGVCVDLACSNANVLARCESYTAYVINSEITFENLPTEMSTPNGSQVAVEDILMQSVKQTAIFEEVVPGAVLQKHKVDIGSHQSCPPGFAVSENVCVESDDIMHLAGVVFGCLIAVIAVVVLSVILYKLRRGSRKASVPDSARTKSEEDDTIDAARNNILNMSEVQGYSNAG